MHLIQYAEIIGTATALIGALIISLNLGRKESFVAFTLYLISNFAWVGFALYHEHSGLLLTNLGFMATSVIGIYRHRPLICATKETQA